MPHVLTSLGFDMAFAVTFSVPLLDAVAFGEEKLPASTGDGVIC